MTTVAIDLATWRPTGMPREFDPVEIIDWAARRFAGRPTVMTTAFGMEGVVLLDMLVERLPDIRVIYIDTAFLFPETLRLRDALIAHYPSVRFEGVVPLHTPQEQASRFGDELWKTDPELCCRMRKVEPLHRAMQGVDVWFTSIQRSQSATRGQTRIIDWDWQYQVIKVCPLASWSREQTYRYVRARSLPYNELHDRGYPTVGCTHCTAPVPGTEPWEYSRAGRWCGTDKTECGLHNGEGI